MCWVRIFGICVIEWVFLCNSASAESTAPSADAMLTIVDNLWVEGCFDELHKYVEGLTQEYPDYIPARIIRAEWLRLRGGCDIESYLAEMTKLQTTTLSDMRLLSPLYREVIEGQIDAMTATLRRYASKGWTREFRKEHFAAGALKQRLPWDRIRDLLLFVPQVSVSVTSSGSQLRDHRGAPSVEMTAETARELIQNTNAKGPDRAQAIRFVGCRHTEGQLPFLAPFMRNSDPFVAEAAAEAVSSYGEDALQSILGAIEDDVRGLSPRTFCVWALLRLESESPAIEQAIQEVAKSRIYSERKYAEDALAYLRSGKR